MIIVLGSVCVAAGEIESALATSQAHVARSRAEPGCLEHGVSIDADAENRLVFVERWASREALEAHFAVPESRAFVKALGAIAVSAPSMKIYEADEVSVGTARAKRTADGSRGAPSQPSTEE